MKATDDELVTLDDLALELADGGRALPKPLGPPTRTEVQRWLSTKLNQRDPELKGWATNEAALRAHCASVVAHQALGLLKRI